MNPARQPTTHNRKHDAYRPSTAYSAFTISIRSLIVLVEAFWMGTEAIRGLRPADRNRLLILCGVSLTMVVTGLALFTVHPADDQSSQVANPPIVSTSAVIHYLQSAGVSVQVQQPVPTGWQAQEAVSALLSLSGEHATFSLLTFDTAATAGRQAFLHTLQQSDEDPPVNQIGNLLFVAVDGDTAFCLRMGQLIADFLQGQQ